MVIHDPNGDKAGKGKWESHSGRYISFGGGTRSRLPVLYDKSIRRYFGFVGMDESMTATMSTMTAFLGHISGGVYIPEGPAGDFIQKLLGIGTAPPQQAEDL